MRCSTVQFFAIPIAELVQRGLIWFLIASVLQNLNFTNLENAGQQNANILATVNPCALIHLVNRVVCVLLPNDTFLLGCPRTQEKKSCIMLHNDQSKRRLAVLSQHVQADASKQNASIAHESCNVPFYDKPIGKRKLKALVSVVETDSPDVNKGVVNEKERLVKWNGWGFKVRMLFFF